MERCGFKKSGIHPLNSQVVPDNKYDPEALKRWKQFKEEQKRPQENAPEMLDVTIRQNDQQLLNEKASTSSATSFEGLLLQKSRRFITVKRNQTNLKKKRVAVEAEVLTQPEDLRRLKEMEKQKLEKQKNKKIRGQSKNTVK
jgi:hypothetical protein